jgi:RNA polymerase sigma-70 factor (family 1)
VSVASPHTEKELFLKIAQGDTAAFKIIFDAYSEELSPFIIKLTRSRETAREVIQDIFLQIWQKKEKLAEVDNPRAWMIRLASNTAINYLRKKASEGRLFEKLSTMTEPIHTPEKILATKEMASLIGQAIQTLPAAQQAVYKLSREQHLTIPEIAHKQGVSPNTAKNQLVSALKNIRQFLEKALQALIVWLFFS